MFFNLLSDLLIQTQYFLSACQNIFVVFFSLPYQYNEMYLYHIHMAAKKNHPQMQKLDEAYSPLKSLLC